MKRRSNGQGSSKEQHDPYLLLLSEVFRGQVPSKAKQGLSFRGPSLHACGHTTCVVFCLFSSLHTQALFVTCMLVGSQGVPKLAAQSLLQAPMGITSEP
eukprot:1159681-Pelagomonas_calceolata.AAC.2